MDTRRTLSGLAGLLGATLLYGCGGESSPTQPPPPPPPAPTPTLQSVSCRIDPIPDVSFEDTLPAIAPGGTESYGVLSDGARVALDSLVVTVNDARVSRLLGVNGDWTVPALPDTLLREGSNTGAARCYASRDGTSAQAGDTESFRLTRIIPPLPAFNSLPSIDLKEDGNAGASTAGVVTNGELTRITAASGNVNVEYKADKDSLYVTPAPDWNGQYVLQFEAGNDQGLVTLDGTYTVQAQPDFLTGQLQDNETDTGKAGQLELLIDGTPIGTVNTDGSGNWEKQNLPEGNELTIKARLNEGSYIRTVRADISDNGDVTIPLIRAVPYAGLSANGISIEDFKAHMSSLKLGGTFITRLDIENFRKSCYFINNPEPSDDGSSFSQNQINEIIEAWTSTERIPKLLENRSFIIEECETNDYKIDPLDGRAIPDKGILIWVPDKNLPARGLGVAMDINGDGVGDSGFIRINTNVVSNLKRTAAHEAGHALHSWLHPTILPNAKTIMAIPVTPDTPQFADEKATSIVLDTAFRHRESLDDVLGL